MLIPDPRVLFLTFLFVMVQPASPSAPLDTTIGQDAGRPDAAAVQCQGGSCKGQRGELPLVSVVTPTRASTQHRHRLLYETYAHQTYPRKELVVLDDSPFPSPFFSSLSDPSVKYTHVPGAPAALGAKRNALADAAEGTVIAHFDDDDYYAPLYLERMVAELEGSRTWLVKLSGFFSFSCKIGLFGYWDPAETAVFGEVGDERYKYSLFLDPRDPIIQTWVMGPSDEYDAKLRDETRYGFGFSYVYKKSLAKKVAFNSSQTFGEDLAWVSLVLERGHRVKHFADTEGLALHLQGDWNTARIPVQYRIPSFLLTNILGPSVGNYTQPCGGKGQREGGETQIGGGRGKKVKKGGGKKKQSKT